MKIIFILTMVTLVFFLSKDNKTELGGPSPQEKSHINSNSLLVPTENPKNIGATFIQPVDQVLENPTTEQLNAEIRNIETKLSTYSEFSFEQFTDVQLKEFNSLVQRKAVLLKKYIFRKYSTQYGRNLI